MKYVITPEGKSEFRTNRTKYRQPSVFGKILSVLVSGVGYTPASLLDFVESDPLVRKKSVEFARTLSDLLNVNYIRSIDDDVVIPQGGESNG